MTRVSLAFAALAAAGITAASIGFAVFWAYGPGDVPRETPVSSTPSSEAVAQSKSGAVPEARSPAASVAPALPPASRSSAPGTAAAPAAPTPVATAPAAAPQVAAQPVAPIAEPARPSATRQENVAALPQPAEKTREAAPVTSEPKIGIVRGGRRIAASHPRASQEPKSAAAPRSHPAQIATDARTITVLRGGHWPRYAMAGRAEPSSAKEPALVVFRGARPRAQFAVYRQPSALILHVRD